MYGVLFSVVLLNTDLNIVNIGIKSGKKMTLKIFVKNTFDLVESLVPKSNNGAQDDRKWRKDFENTLKYLFQSVKDNPITQHLQDHQIAIVNTSNAKPNQPKSNLVSATTTGEETLISPPSGKFSRASSFSNLVTRILNPQFDSIIKSIKESNATIVEGVLIRKTLKDEGGVESSGIRRKWKKVWATLCISERSGVELKFYKILSRLNEREYEPSELIVPKSQANTFGDPDVYKPMLSSSPEHVSLIHSFASICAYEKRTNVIRLHLSDGEVVLFECHNANLAKGWINFMNYYSGLRSRKCMRGGVGNSNYGWSKFEDPVDKVEKVDIWTRPNISTRLVCDGQEV